MPKVVPLIISGLLILVLMVVIASMMAHYHFNQSVKKEVETFYEAVRNKHEVVSENDLNGLPSPVQNWMQNSQIVGKEKIVSARTKQEVTLRLKENQPWMNAQVEQYFRIDEPGFIWAVDIKMAPLLHIVGRDKYIEGRGNILIKLLFLKTVADGSGKEIDQGALLRYLAEIMWFPTAALSEYIQWEGIDSNSAKATMSYMGVTASGVYTFSEKGEILSFVAQRYGDFDGEYRMETWSCAMKKYKEFDGFKVPSQGNITWKLKTGDFEWYHFEVKEMEYNNVARY
ncbi:DUF6544 family protein [Desulfosporosinus sp. BICA1-9]|uniref:DUF6544 family protein n=1 Tax=Desulfosporosinus sp. BICA1-9 TaxID=1531958 RepID=UPI00054BE19B|nr:DUF6544 family protein [Desulfosporosinus sp. BICA1-9]KJS83878.1 MAG: hypothetical protein JL57_21935 [Desulfosporosinus sp. BICA1-9]HBW38722.1 hypothetical protein [Desulfosporosinus sp.]